MASNPHYCWLWCHIWRPRGLHDAITDPRHFRKWRSHKPHQTAISGPHCGPVWAAVMSPLYPASFSTPCVTPILQGKPPFGMDHGTRQIQWICVWDFNPACLADPHRLEKILPFRTPRKSGPMGAGMGIRGCFLTPAAKASHKPIQAVIEGISPLWLQRKKTCMPWPTQQHLTLCVCAIPFDIYV